MKECEASGGEEFWECGAGVQFCGQSGQEEEGGRGRNPEKENESRRTTIVGRGEVFFQDQKADNSWCFGHITFEPSTGLT